MFVWPQKYVIWVYFHHCTLGFTKHSVFLLRNWIYIWVGWKPNTQHNLWLSSSLFFTNSLQFSVFLSPHTYTLPHAELWVDKTAFNSNLAYFLHLQWSMEFGCMQFQWAKGTQLSYFGIVHLQDTAYQLKVHYCHLMSKY